MRGLAAVFLVWLYAGDLVRFIKVQSAPVALLNAQPSLLLSLLGTAVAFAVTALLILDAGGRLPREWRMRGIIHFAAAALLFIDFSILSSRLSPLPAEMRVAGVIQALADAANNAATTEQVPTDRRAFEEWARENGGAVPLFKDGVRLEQWHVELREGCVGPASVAGQSPPGTLVYCVSPDRRRAWITAVAVPLGRRFGTAEIISTEGAFLGDVQVAREEIRDDEPPVWESPTP